LHEVGLVVGGDFHRMPDFGHEDRVGDHGAADEAGFGGGEGVGRIDRSQTAADQAQAQQQDRSGRYLPTTTLAGTAATLPADSRSRAAMPMREGMGLRFMESPVGWGHEGVNTRRSANIPSGRKNS